jgi:two-component system, OmpR family, response regulator PrrA
MIEGQPPLILVADDDPDIVSFLVPSFEAAGMRVVEAHDGLETLRAVTAHRPEALVLDIGMPALDGKAVLRILQKLGGDAPAVIFLTAHALPENRVEGLELGAVDYVVKPFDTDELIARVGAAVRMRRRIRAAEGC